MDMDNDWGMGKSVTHAKKEFAIHVALVSMRQSNRGVMTFLWPLITKIIIEKDLAGKIPFPLNNTRAIIAEIQLVNMQITNQQFHAAKDEYMKKKREEKKKKKEEEISSSSSYSGTHYNEIQKLERVGAFIDWKLKKLRQAEARLDYD